MVLQVIHIYVHNLKGRLSICVPLRTCDCQVSKTTGNDVIAVSPPGGSAGHLNNRSDSDVATFHSTAALCRFSRA